MLLKQEKKKGTRLQQALEESRSTVALNTSVASPSTAASTRSGLSLNNAGGEMDIDTSAGLSLRADLQEGGKKIQSLRIMLQRKEGDIKNLKKHVGELSAEHGTILNLDT